MVGGLSVLFGVHRLWTEGRGPPAATRGLPEWMGSLFGAASGFTSQIAHAGAPPFQMWVMPSKLSRDLLVGTTAVYFGATNRSEEHTSELQSLMRNSYAVFCLKK